MITYRRRVRLEEIDGAQIVFFGKYAGYAHEAMEHLLEGLDGTYVAMFRDRRICFATVALDSRFSAPLRYGDEVAIAVDVVRLGNRSAQLRYRFVRGDGVASAELLQTVVQTDMTTLASCDMAADARALFAAHLILT